MKGRRPRRFNLSTLYIGNNNCGYIGINYMCIRVRPNCVELWTSTVYIIVTAKCNYYRRGICVGNVAFTDLNLEQVTL